MDALTKLHQTVTRAYKVHNFPAFFDYILFIYFIVLLQKVFFKQCVIIMLISFLIQVNPNIKFEVFIHKVDGLTDDHKIGMISETILEITFKLFKMDNSIVSELFNVK